MHVERSLIFRIRSFQWPQSTSGLIALPFPSHSPLIYSPLLALPVHPSYGTHWLVSHLFNPGPIGIRTQEALDAPQSCTIHPAHTSIYISYTIYRLIALSVTTPIDCQALFVFIQWAGNTTIGASSSLLLVRTIAVWNRSPYVIAPMLLLAIGQWGLLYYSQLN